MKTIKVPSFPLLCALLALVAAFAPVAVAAPPEAHLSKTVDELSRKLKALQEELERVKLQQQSPPTSSGSSGVFVPEIGMVGDFVATLSGEAGDEEGNNRLSARHVELILGHDVDPYTRFDSTLAFSDEHGFELEEAYLTYFGLPAETKARLGRVKPRIGITPGLHLDSQDTVDQPLVVSEYFGEDGYSASGIELSNFVPEIFSGLTQEVIGGVVEGGNGDHAGSLFGDKRNHPSLYGRLKNSVDLSDHTTVNLGASFLASSADEERDFDVRTVGLDASLTQRFSEGRRLKIQSEVYLQNRDSGALGESHGHGDSEGHLHSISLRDEEDHGEDHEHENEGDETEHEEDHDKEDHDGSGDMTFRENPVGWYTLVDYRLHPQWGVGARFDQVDIVNRDDEQVRSYDRAISGYLTFYQSEFARFRLQYQNLIEADDSEDNRVMLQATVAIGTHKHNIQ